MLPGLVDNNCLKIMMFPQIGRSDDVSDLLLVAPWYFVDASPQLIFVINDIISSND
jgi:hypothetical protein